MIDGEGDGARLAAGRRLFASGAEYMLSVHSLTDLPPAGAVEVAFAGRSNVGKSSLINALLNRKKLAHTSNTPGRTQALNFFRVNDDLHIVDMPGYGYARAPKDAVEAWTALVRAYLRGRPTLRRVFLLIDCRRGPGKSDTEIMDLLDAAAVSYQIVLTKSDKSGVTALDLMRERSAAAVAKRPAAHPAILSTSAEKKWGIDELRAEIAALAV